MSRTLKAARRALIPLAAIVQLAGTGLLYARHQVAFATETAGQERSG